MGVPVREQPSVARTFNAGGGTTKSAALMATVLAGDRILAQVLNRDTGTTVTTPTGWTPFGSNNTGGSGASGSIARWYYRDATASEGGNSVGWVLSQDVDTVVFYTRILAGTFDADTAPELAVLDNDTQENPPNLNPSNWGAEPTLWGAGWHRFGTSASGSTPPADFFNQLTGVTGGASPVGGALAWKNDWVLDQINPGLFAGSESTSLAAFTLAVRGKVYALPYPGFRGRAVSTPNTATTTWTLTIPANVQAGDELIVAALSRDHTAGTALATLTDNDTGGNTWTLKDNSTDRKAYVFRKKATSGSAGKTVTFAGAVGSSCGGLVAFVNTLSGDPITNLVRETNAAGDESHASFTPSQDNSFVVAFVYNYANDNVVTLGTWATLGVAEEEAVRAESTGGSDCAVDMFVKLQPGTAASTGAFTWAQTNGTTYSITFAVAPVVSVARTFDEDLGLDDTMTAELEAARSQTDEADLDDAMTATQAAARSRTDPLGLTDSVTAQRSVPIEATDDLSLTDSVTAELEASQTPQDALGLTDAATSTQAAARARNDALGLTDALSGAQAAARARTDPLGMVDSIAAAIETTRSATDDLSLTDSLAAVLEIPKSATDPLGILDAAIRQLAAARPQLDDVALVDDLAWVLDFERAQLESLGLTDSVTLELDLPRDFTDSLGLTDDLSYELTAPPFITPDPIGTGPGGIPMAPAGVLSPGAGFTITPDPITMTPDPAP